MMKTKLFFAGMAFLAITSIGLSQNSNPRDMPGRGQGNLTGMIDENKNGVCDVYENGSTRQGRGNGMGNCKRMGMNQGQPGQGMMNGQGRGRNFADENKDGVCDHFVDVQKDDAGKKDKPSL